MAQAKVSHEALVKMAEILRQGAEDILSAKEEMDGQLRSFIWDDPIGMAFSGKYEEDFKPLTNKLLPALSDYLNYLTNIKYTIDDYGDISAIIGFGGIAGTEIIRESLSNSQKKSALKKHEISNHLELNKKLGNNVLSHSSDPTNIGLSQKEYERIKNTPEYKRRKDGYYLMLNKLKPNLNEEIKSSDIDYVNSVVLGLKPDELKVKFTELGREMTLGGREIKENAYINNDFLNAHPGWTHCGAGGIGSHESTHALQYKIYKRVKKIIKEKPNVKLSEREKSILENFPNQYKSWSRAYYNDPMEKDARISHYAWNDACNQYVKETFLKNK